MTMENTEKTQAQTQTSQPNNQARRPNEIGSLQVQSHLRIFDPNTQKTIVETRE